jgi:hypothetical protein
MTNLVRQSQNTSLQINSVEDLQRLSEVLAKSGFFEDAKSASQCFVKILAGKELGFPAFSSMTGIHIIKGKPAIGANLMAATIKGSGKYDYRVKTLTGELCEIEFFEGAASLGISSFSKADAVAAGTGTSNSMITKFARNMLFARAISNGVRFYCPDIFLGAPVYTPEELGIEVDQEGEIIDVSALTPASQDQPITRSNRNWALIKQWTTFDSDAIVDIAIKENLPTKPSDLTPSQSDQLFKAVLVHWAINVYPSIFKARSHAVNAFNKISSDNGGYGDEFLWNAWSSDCLKRSSENLELIPSLE